MLELSYPKLAAYGLALIATLVLAALLSPASWWRRPNLRAAAVLALGTWGIGALLLGFMAAPGQARGVVAALGQPHAQPTVQPSAGVHYRVRDDLNLRASTGTSATRIAVVPAGASVTATGLRDGDWWQLRARVDGKEVQGWSSSLWLRRADE